MITSKKTILVAASMLAVFATAADAAEIIRPDIGEPLRDAAVTRAPDGTYYLTGTRCMNKRFVFDEETRREAWTDPEKSLTPDGRPDFMSNDGVKLWSSKDLSVWNDEGLVYDLTQRGKWHDSLSHLYALPDRPLGAPPVRGAVAPRLQIVDGKYCITLSNVGHDVRWLTADQPTGPYRDGWSSGLHVYQDPYMRSRGPGHGSIFTDTDGTSYLVRGPGYLEKMTPDLKDKVPAEARFLLGQVAGYPNAEWCAGQFDPRGAAVALLDGKYVLTWAAYTDAAGYRRDDSFYAVADKLTGPYSDARPLIPGSGPVVLFDAEGKGPMASCSIDDEPVLVPLEFENEALIALARPELPRVAGAPGAGEPEMFDYANAKPSGRWCERAGEELQYKAWPVFSDKKPDSEAERVGRHRLVPLFDQPITDVSVCRGADAWYLTGTAASRRSGRSDETDFSNNDGIYLWRSTDLDTWTPLGNVWDIEEDGGAWQKQYRIPGNDPLRDDFCRGVSAPEIHFIDNTYYIAYSMNGRGTGLLRSRSGNAEGPYADLGRVTATGEGASLFADAGGARYWLFGKGLQMAEIDLGNASLRGVVRDVLPRLVAFKGSTYNNASGYWDVTGPFMFGYFDTDTGTRRYALSFSAVTQVNERAHRDSVLAVADGLDGVFKSAMRMIPHGGQTTVFPGPGGAYWATFSGSDPSAVFRDRAAIVPMEAYRSYAYQDEPIRWPRMVQGDYYTTRGPWLDLMPPAGLKEFSSADPEVFHAPDGYYYYSASPQGLWRHFTDTNGGLRYWRSRNLEGPYEDIGWLYTMEQMRDDPKWPEIDADYKHWNNSKMAWEPWMGYGKGTYWITMWFGGHGWGKDVVWKQSRSVLLRSTSGKATGPYVLHFDGPSNIQGLLFDEDGSVYGFADGPLWKMNDDLTAIDETWTERDGRTVRSRYGNKGIKSFRFMTNGRQMTEDCNLLFYKIDGRYVARGLTGNNSYDGVFSWSEDIRGPYHYLGVVPYLGNGPIVKNEEGKWVTIPQCGNTASFASPFRNSDKTRAGGMFLYEVVFDLKRDNPSVWPAHDLRHLDEAVYR